MAAALLALGFARIVPLMRARLWIEVVVAVLAGIILGIVAMPLDFAGDWRSAAFAFLGTAAAIGCARLAAG
jgi:hypothetical protein